MGHFCFILQFIVISKIRVVLVTGGWSRANNGMGVFFPYLLLSLLFFFAVIKSYVDTIKIKII